MGCCDQNLTIYQRERLSDCKPKQVQFCNAIPGTQGQDWTTTYSYDLTVPDGVAQKLAYVECDYCE